MVKNNKDSTKIVNNKANTSLLIEYLEATIVDEMILNSFIRDIKIVNITDSYIVISVATDQTRKILKENYLTFFKNGIEQILDKKLEINFILHGENINLDNKITKNYISENISSKYTFENYIEGKFNNEVIKIGKTLIKHLGKFSPLFITANSGLGKTHLLHAIGNIFIKKNMNAAYIEPNNFTRKVRELSNDSNEALSNFIDQFSNFDILLFDDIQNLGDRTVTLKVLFNIINNSFENNKQVVLVADKSPQELSGFESRFITRFQSGITSKIDMPDIDDLIKVLKFKLDGESLQPEKWELEALKFIARNNSTSIRAIEGAVKRVAFFSLTASNIKYTYNSISNLFKELQIDPKELTPQRIISTVANYYKLKINEINGRTRKSNIVVARHMAMYLIRTINKISYAEIGKIIGGRDHSTVMSAIENIKLQMKMNNAVKLASEKIEKNIKTIK